LQPNNLHGPALLPHCRTMWRTLIFVLLWMGAGFAFTELAAYGLQYWRLNEQSQTATGTH
jgi:RsiW-degrading membrane proteinase PrsW (M82 family)